MNEVLINISSLKKAVIKLKYFLCYYIRNKNNYDDLNILYNIRICY